MPNDKFEKTALRFVMIAALLLAFAVGTGAFGAHALKKWADESMLAIWQTAVLYQFIHALGLLFLGTFMLVLRRLSVVYKHFVLIGSLFIAGIVCFSGSLYLLVLLGTKYIGIITPIGGAMFILAWLMLCLALLRYYRQFNRIE